MPNIQDENSPSLKNMASKIANHFIFPPSSTVVDNPTTPEHHNPINPPRRTIIKNQMPDHLYIERERLLTFQTWTKPFIAKEKLAMYGFYHCGPNDNVKCVFCKVEIGSWEVGDNVLREHLRWSPNCPLLKRRQTRNEPIDSESFERSLPPITVDTVGMHFPIEYRENSYPENEYYDQTYSLLNHPDYRKINDRLKSFSEWPKSMRQKPAELSDAGFFYLGKGDQVKCFSCGGGLKDWESDDVPWEQHALWYSSCQYLNECKSADYIQEIKNKHETKEENSSNTTNNSTNVQVQLKNGNENTTEDTNINDSKLCKICCDNEMNAILFPCMHIVACVTCAYSLDSCPLCRTKITECKRIYFS